MVDTSYRQEFKDLFDANFGRLDARLAQQAGELRAETHAGLSHVRAEMRAEFAAVRGELQAGLAAVRGELQAGLGAVRGDMRAGFAELRTEIALSQKSLIRWMFGFWIGAGAILVGMLLGLHQLGVLGGR